MSRSRVALSDSDCNVFHLELVLTFLSFTLERLLTDSLNLGLQVQDDLPILLLPVDVVLLLRHFRLLEFILFLESFHVHLIVLLIQIWPILRCHLQGQILIDDRTILVTLSVRVVTLFSQQCDLVTFLLESEGSLVTLFFIILLVL